MPNFDDAREVHTVDMWDDTPTTLAPVTSPQEYYDQFFRDKKKAEVAEPEGDPEPEFAKADPVEELLKKSAKGQPTYRSNPDDVVGRAAKP